MNEEKKEKLLYFSEMQKEVTEFRKQLNLETDRGCALFATSYIDKALADMLASVLVQNPNKVEKDMFDFMSPLGSFSSRIKMAFYLGKISKKERKDLDILRKIRNKFAHHPTVVSFEDEDVTKECRKLAYSYRKNKANSRSHFCSSVFGILAHIHGEIFNATPIEEKSDRTPSEDTKAEHRKSLGLDE